MIRPHALGKFYDLLVAIAGLQRVSYFRALRCVGCQGPVLGDNDEG